MRGYRRIPAFAAFLLLLCSGGTGAQNRLPESCYESDDMGSYVNEIIDYYRVMIRMIEGVPPSEREYIRVEREAALNDGNNARFALVFSNRFYHAFQVHEAYDAVVLDLAEAAAATTERLRASRLISALGEAADLSVAVSDYIDADYARAQRVLPENGAERLSFHISYTKGLIQAAANCALDRIP